MSTKPLVSVIIPTYGDRTARLQSAIASIWAQDGLGEQFDVEVIVVDNASPGPVEEVVRRFPGTRYIRLETNRGQTGGRNIGIAESTGKYLAFLDHDDLWLPNRLAPQVALLEQTPGVEIAYSQRALYGADGWSNVYPGPTAPSGWLFETAAKSFIAHLSTILVPREAFAKVGSFDERLPVLEDHDITARLALYFPFRFVPGVVTIYLPSMTARSQEMYRQALLTKKDNLLATIQGRPDEAELRRLVLCTTSWDVSYRFYRAGQFDQARREFLEWIGEFHPLEGDAWASSKMREMTFLLAFASDSPVELASLGRAVNRPVGPTGLRRRLEVRALLADAWTGVALYYAAEPRREDRMAGSVAVKAIRQNPLKLRSRPGLLRLAARAIAHPGRGREAQQVPSRQSEYTPSNRRPIPRERAGRRFIDQG